MNVTVCLFIILREVIFPHLVVTLTALETPKNILAFSSRIFRLFGTPKKSQVKSSRPKKYLLNFPSKKKPETKISNPPQSFDPPEVSGFHFFLVQDTTVWVLLCKAFSNREKRSGDEIAFQNMSGERQ